MKHIGIALLHNGKPTGRMKALCGAMVASLVPAGESSDLCPVCKRINDEEGA